MGLFKKHLYLHWLIVFLLFLCISTMAAATGKLDPEKSTEKQPAFCLKTIVIDAGHGGKDPGNVNPWKTKEKDVNLAIALKLAARIRSQAEYEVLLTRMTDSWISLADRARFANQFPANEALFISIHCNAHADSTIHGVETYVFNLNATDELAETLAERENAEEHINPIEFIVNNLHQRASDRYSREAAQVIQSSLVSVLKSRDRNRGAPDRLVRRAPFRVLADTNMPAILVELGFLSNKKENQTLTSSAHQARIANALLAGIRQLDRLTRESREIEPRTARIQ